MSLPIRKNGSGSMIEKLKYAAIQQRRLYGSSHREALVLMLDSSGSMANRDCNGISRFEAARNAIGRFIAACNPAISLVGLATFNDSVTKYIEPTSNYGLMISSLTEFPYGNTFMYSAIINVCKELGEYETSVKRVVLLSDGWSNDHHYGIGDAISRAKASGVILDTIAFGDTADVESLRRLAVETGGVFRDVPLSAELLARTYQQLEVRVRGLLENRSKR